MSDSLPKDPSLPPISQDGGAKAATAKCVQCGYLNRVGILICESCGKPLSEHLNELGTKQFSSTKQFSQEDREAALGPEATDTAELMRAAVASAGTSKFTDDMVLRLEIEGATTPILLFPKKETVIGRRDTGTNTMPDVDLSMYAGYRMGVSRRHAVIRLRNSEIEIFDLGSSNGTSVNGMRLTPHQTRQLRDGDEIALGKMTMRVLFQLRTRRRSLT